MAKREIRFYKHYFNEFFVAQTDKVRRKIAQTLVWIQTIDRLPVSILKSIEGKKGLYEIRVEYAGNIYRVFCCFDEGALVILFNGFQKKTQKTPVSEIDKAERLMKEYFILRPASLAIIGQTNPHGLPSGSGSTPYRQ